MTTADATPRPRAKPGFGGRPLADTITEYLHLSSCGYSLQGIAYRLGIKAESLQRALYRGRHAGLL